MLKLKDNTKGERLHNTLHLHVHTEHSLLDELPASRMWVARAKELGMESWRSPIMGVMFGAVDFYKECKKQGIKPIIGCEVYTAARKHG